MLLKCSETKKQREHFVCTTCLSMNEEVAYKEIIRCINAGGLKILHKKLKLNSMA
jgi:hypothetical protein